MILSLCSHCNGCRLRTVHRSIGPQRSKRKQILTPHGCLLVVATTLLLSLAPLPIHSQQPPPHPYTYTPRYSAGSAIANNSLYVVSGYLSNAFPSDAVGDTIFVPLDRPFTNDSVPWMTVKPPWDTPKTGSMNGTDPVIVPTADRARLVFFGPSGPSDPPVMVYDVLGNFWSPFRSGVVVPRSAVGAALDPGTGAIVVQGGIARGSNMPLSAEIDILSSSGGLENWSWTMGSPTTKLNSLFQPIIAYLPTRKVTIIIGGADYVNNSITTFPQLNTGFMVTTTTVNNVTVLSTASFSMTGSGTAIPKPRLSPCYTVLDSGDLFMYGGVTFSSTLNEAWILHAADFTWSAVTISQNPDAGRAGATCQQISPDHIMIVGGYNAPLRSNTRLFAQPQIGIINTKQWTWTTSYSPPRSGPSLPLGAIVGIVLGGSILLGVGLFFAVRVFWRKPKARTDRKNNQDTGSTHPLMGNDSALTMESDRFLSTRNLVSPAPSVPVSSKVGTEFHSVSLSSPKDERSLPLIISPYAPSSSHNSSSFSVAGTDSTERGSNSPWNSYKSKGAKSEMSLPESERLSKTVADMQYGYYVKTLQHNKQYEKRRSDLSRQQPNNGLNRNITLNQYAILKDNSHDDVDLATAVLNLKDVELGEESIMIPLQTLETGTILVSSHLDLEQAGLQSPSANGPAPLMPMRSIPLRNNNAPAKTELNENEDEDEEIYTPGVGGSITMLNALKAAKAAKAAQTAQAGRGSASSAGTGPGSGRGVMPPLSEELISEESEVLVDNRRSRRPQ